MNFYILIFLLKQISIGMYKITICTQNNKWEKYHMISNLNNKKRSKVKDLELFCTLEFIIRIFSVKLFI